MLLLSPLPTQLMFCPVSVHKTFHEVADEFSYSSAICNIYMLLRNSGISEFLLQKINQQFLHKQHSNRVFHTQQFAVMSFS